MQCGRGFGDCREISGLVSADVQTIPERADFRCCAVADEEIFLIRRVRIIAKNKEERDIFLIPPNFLNEGSLFGGMLKLRNTLEAVILVAGITIPILKITVFSFTTKTILLCLTALPICIFALIGVGGESLTAFLMNFFRFLRNRKMQYRLDAMPEQEKSRWSLWQSEGEWPEEYGEEEKLKKSRKTAKGKANEPFPVEKIENGICYLRDKRYIKIIEVEPINFLLRSAREQRNIIYSYMSYLKISPVRMQIKVVSKKADISNHLDKIQEAIRWEQDERCKVLLMDYYNLIRRIGLKEAVTRRFFIVFTYEPIPGSSKKNEEKDAVNQLEIAERTARTYLMQCGNNVVEHENADSFMAEVLYMLLNRKTSTETPFSARAAAEVEKYIAEGDANAIPISAFLLPEQMDFGKAAYCRIDGLYYSYFMIPSTGYKTQVTAGWLSLLVNAGEGIDVDLFLSKEPKEKIQFQLGRQIRINRSKMKETSDTNTDFDDIDSAVRAGYYLKDGLANNQDFYYINTLITITADSREELEWRTNEMKKLMLSQDLILKPCYFRQDLAFQSVLPLNQLHKSLYELSKRNALTTGAASCYPYVSFEMSDDNGILLGVNKYNNSLIIVDIFNSRIYKNANMVLLGTSGAGKTFTMQLMALRLREKNIQTFILAPLKGHEFRRACHNIGGEFIQISPASKNCINIMEIRKNDKTAEDVIDGERAERSELSAKIQRLHIFFSLLIPDMTHEERQLLDEALIQTYAGKGITHQNESLYDETGSYKAMPVLGDLYDFLKKNTETRRMANILNRLVHGSASTFNQQTNVRLDNKYIVLDISELTGDLLTVGMFLALDYVWDKAKEDRTQEKAIFIDEVWQLIGASSNRLAAEFVLEIFKIIRGYGGAAICATQDINDFLSLDDGKYGKGIINNSKTKIVLNLEDEEAQRVQHILNLSDTEIMNITHFARGNGLILTNNNTVTVEFKASGLETEMITTDRKQLREMIRRKQE
ncbi:PrgI family protein [Clostridium sp. MCC345]|nr:PrgI family protein [Clostridium sp. MCC345]